MVRRSASCERFSGGDDLLATASPLLLVAGKTVACALERVPLEVVDVPVEVERHRVSGA
jgi:hypothetical protein